MSTLRLSSPRLAATATAVTAALALCAAPLAATAQPIAAAAAVSIGDGTLADADPTLFDAPITYRCEAGTTATITVKVRQIVDYWIVDGGARHTVTCTGEDAALTTTVASHSRDSWQSGPVTGELSIYGEGYATAHQPFAISLRG